MGEIGETDYNTAVFEYKPIEEVKSYVPLVIDTIISAVNELIDMGAQTLVVPGSFPLGCSSSFLTVRASKNKKDYDNRTGCLIRYNELVEYHNDLLKKKLNHLREVHPNVIIIMMTTTMLPCKLSILLLNSSCCGGGGPYNYKINSLAQCGHVLATVCNDPDAYAYWDGIHFTEAAYRIRFKSLFKGQYTTPRFNSLCRTPTPTSTSQVGVALSGSQIQR
ncbi:unnamed protein product [Lactuca saligna]|uniref:GDSL esterase/lipase n=1 Tax=Lactuca saligna TaxID=75948 RepID=A0AA35VMA5_LACSI|nr:unnamed protein product [Lactuca saligna]